MSRVVARGWATVDLDRAAGSLAGLLAPGSRFADASRSAILGARCRVGRAIRDDGAGADWIVLLEPDTEGRLAAHLARHDEGWAVVWEANGGDVRDGTDSAGPLGGERLIDGTPAGDQFRLLLTAATIDR